MKMKFKLLVLFYVLIQFLYLEKFFGVFFGTTRYCSYFLNNQKCPNHENCGFLHQLPELIFYKSGLASDEDLIIDDKTKTEFSFKEHLDLSKKIIKQSYPEIRQILIKPKKFKSRLPWIDFIFLNVEEKQEYCILNNYDYIIGSYDKRIDSSLINNCDIISNEDNINNVKLEINNDLIQNNEIIQSDNSITKNNDDDENFKDFEQMNNVISRSF